MASKMVHLAITRQLSRWVIDYMQPYQLLTHYLMASYAYYILAESVWVDDDYDFLCSRLLEEFGNFEHRHKHLTSVDALEAGTAYHLRSEDYPPQIRHGFPTYIRNMNDGTIESDLLKQGRYK